MLVSELKDDAELFEIENMKNYQTINTLLVVFNIICIVTKFLGSIFVLILSKKYDKIQKSKPTKKAKIYKFIFYLFFHK